LTTFNEATAELAAAKGLKYEVQEFTDGKALAQRLREIADLVSGPMVVVEQANFAFWFDTAKGSPALIRMVGLHIQVQDNRGPTIQ
jgi:hypothetical protein